MSIQDDHVSRFQKVFEDNFGLELGNKETKAAAGNLVSFFSLLARFDREDKEKAKEMEVKQDGGRIQNTRSL